MLQLTSIFTLSIRRPAGNGEVMRSQKLLCHTRVEGRACSGGLLTVQEGVPIVTEEAAEMRAAGPR